MKISCIFIWVFILTHALVLAAKSTNPTNNLKSKIKTPNTGQQKPIMQEPPPPPPIWNNVPNKPRRSNGGLTSCLLTRNSWRAYLSFDMMT